MAAVVYRAGAELLMREHIASILTVNGLAAWLGAWAEPDNGNENDLLTCGDGTPLGAYLTTMSGRDCWVDAHGVTPAGHPDVLVPLPPPLARFDALCQAWPDEVLTAGDALALLWQAARNDDGDGVE